MDEIIELDKEYIKTLYHIEQIRKQINQLQKDINQKIKNKINYDDLVQKKKELELVITCNHPDTIMHNQLSCSQKGTLYLEQCFRALQDKLSLVGNIVDKSVIVSVNEDNNEIIRKGGQIRMYDFN